MCNKQLNSNHLLFCYIMIKTFGTGMMKIKAMLSLRTPRWHGGVEILLHTILTSELNGPGSQLYSPAALSPGMDPLYPLDKMLIAPKDSLGWKWRSLTPARNRTTTPRITLWIRDKQKQFIFQDKITSSSSQLDVRRKEPGKYRHTAFLTECPTQKWFRRGSYDIRRNKNPPFYEGIVFLTKAHQV